MSSHETSLSKTIQSMPEGRKIADFRVYPNKYNRHDANKIKDDAGPDWHIPSIVNLFNDSIFPPGNYWALEVHNMELNIYYAMRIGCSPALTYPLIKYYKDEVKLLLVRYESSDLSTTFINQIIKKFDGGIIDEDAFMYFPSIM